MLHIEFKDVERETQVFEKKYNTPFIEADKRQAERFTAEVDLLASRAEKLIEEAGITYMTSISPLQIPLPSAFLERPLDESQTQIINEHETQDVAATSVKMQESLQPVPIFESFEPMVDLRKGFNANQLPVDFSAIPFHDACGEWGGKNRVFWAREQFANRLVLLGRLLLSQDLGIRFEDAFRPLGVQEGLFQRRVDWTHTAHPDWSREKIIEEARSKTAVTPRLASHKAGAAVDLRLYHINNKELLDIGHSYPDGGALVYLESPFVTQEQWINRSILRAAAYLCDIAMYVGEDWHLSHGDNLASLDPDLIPRDGYVAKYGPVKRFNNETGAIERVYDIDELDEAFDFKL